MPFATINSNLSYWLKQDKALFADLLWNIPERKTGKITLVGGNSQGFSTVVRLAELLNKSFPLQDVRVLLPDVLQGKTPPLPSIDFAPSTASGSFAKSSVLNNAFINTDFTFLPGDLSRNSETEIALGSALSTALNENNISPLLLTRDASDSLIPSAERLLSHSNLFLVVSLPQLQKLFRAIYYPKMILLSAPLLQIVETLHKFTLSYTNLTILTFHEGNIIVARGGELTTTHLENTPYSPISLWSGQLAAIIAAINLYNPNHQLAATSAAILHVLQ